MLALAYMYIVRVWTVYMHMCTLRVGCVLPSLGVTDGVHALSPGGHSSGGKVRGPRFNPGWLPVSHGSLNIFPSLSSCTCTYLYMVMVTVLGRYIPYMINLHVYMS